MRGQIHDLRRDTLAIHCSGGFGYHNNTNGLLRKILRNLPILLALLAGGLQAGVERASSGTERSLVDMVDESHQYATPSSGKSYGFFVHVLNILRWPEGSESAGGRIYK